MDAFYLVKIGEILLKLGNRKEFEDRLRSQLNRRLEGIAHKVELYPGRYFVTVSEEYAAAAEYMLSRMPGVNGYARAFKVEKRVDAVFAAALQVAGQAVARGERRFKAESRRSDKSFALGSFELSAEIGAQVLAAYPETHVDLHHPEFTINVEIRERAYVYGDPLPGLRGLPVGSGGKGLLLLSGGIDSPVAGYMMARRGLSLEAIYFHAYPYTSQEAKDKVVALGRVVASFSGGLKLWTIPFTETQLKIKKEAREDLVTVMTRAAMMEAAGLLAERIGANSLVTGESLGQVASQTAENKEETIAMAKKIGSFDISILPYEDCCVVFSPKHPLLRAKLERETEAYEKLGLRAFITEAVTGAELIAIPYPLPSSD
jgi:thiamine biosynthesis protein ThiI